MSYKFSIAATAVCFALAGCMGSGSDTTVATDTPTDNAPGDTSGGSSSGGSTGDTSGGSSSGGSTTVSTLDTATSGAMDVADVNSALVAISALSNGSLPVAQDPQGTARMDGALKFELPGDGGTTRIVAGKLSMDVDFDNKKVTGDAGSFAFYNQAADGSASTRRTENPGTLAVDGTLQNDGSLSATAKGVIQDDVDMDTNLDLAGKVYDSSGTLATSGSVTGTVSAGTESGAVSNGGYVAAEQ